MRLAAADYRRFAELDEQYDSLSPNAHPDRDRAVTTRSGGL